LSSFWFFKLSDLDEDGMAECEVFESLKDRREVAEERYSSSISSSTVGSSTNTKRHPASAAEQTITLQKGENKIVNDTK
jgi:hypothetical protein